METPHSLRELNEKLADEYLGTNASFIYGIDDHLGFPIPFVEKLGRGKYEFIVNGNTYQLYQSTYNKNLHNRIGGQYSQKQKTWGIKKTDGNFEYANLELEPSEYFTTKDEVIEQVNREILGYEIKKVLKKHKKEIELADYEDFKKAYEKADKDDKIKALEIVIDIMDRSNIKKEDALAQAYGYVPIVFGYKSKYISKNLHDARRDKHISRSIQASFKK